MTFFFHNLGQVLVSLMSYTLACFLKSKKKRGSRLEAIFWWFRLLGIKKGFDFIIVRLVLLASEAVFSCVHVWPGFRLSQRILYRTLVFT